MAKVQMKKVMLYLPASTLSAYNALADRSGTSRSEVMRGVLDRGLMTALKSCERAERLSESGGFGAPPPVVRREPRRVPVPTPAERLVSYAANLVRANPHLDDEQFRAMIEAQAVVVEVPADSRASVVEQILASYESDDAGDPHDDHLDEPSVADRSTGDGDLS